MNINKRKNKLTRLLSIVLMLCMLCPLSVQTVSAARFNYREVAIYKGRSFQLKAPTKVKKWASSNNTIASVSKNGVVTGNGIGTCKIAAALSDGSRATCWVTVRSTSSSKYISNAQMTVALNIIGAVESGGQVYGERDYASYAGPGANAPTEHSATAGAFQEYGENLRQLLLRIQKEFPYYFKNNDTANIAQDIKKPWYDSTPFTAKNGSKKAKAIVNIISKKKKAIRIQDIRCKELIDEYLAHARKLGIKNVRAALFLAECEHLGGASSAERVVKRATDKNSIKALYLSLIKDRKDKTSNYQIGDDIFTTRHKLCYKWIIAYIGENAVMR